MLIGNHSAGKSSFINYYIGEQIQKTGVAIETRGFSFVTSGHKRETLTGEATVHFFEHLQVGRQRCGNFVYRCSRMPCSARSCVMHCHCISARHGVCRLTDSALNLTLHILALRRHYYCDASVPSFLVCSNPLAPQDFASFSGILPNLSTEVTTSKERAFNCVDFIDTPGLVDGDMQYPFGASNVMF